MKIKTDIKTLQEIHDMVTAEGNLYVGENKDTFVKDYVLTVEDDAVTVQGISNQIAVVSLTYEDVEVLEEGHIVVHNAEKFDTILSRFNSGDEVTLSDDGDTLTLKRDSPAKTFTMKSVDPDNVESYDGAEAFIERYQYDADADEWVISGDKRLDTKVTISTTEMREIISDAEAVDAPDYPFDVSDGELVVDIGTQTDGHFNNTVPVESAKGSASGRYKYAIDGIVNQMDEVIDLYFGSGLPLLMRNTFDEGEAVYIIAPVRDDS